MQTAFALFYFRKIDIFKLDMILTQLFKAHVDSFMTSRKSHNRFISMKKRHFSIEKCLFSGLSGETRTPGLLNPIQARYQTALHPDV